MDNYQPTNQLRFVKRWFSVAEMGNNVRREKMVLQQAWAPSSGGQIEWRDVPVADEIEQSENQP